MFEPISVHLNVNGIMRTPPDLPGSLVLWAKTEGKSKSMSKTLHQDRREAAAENIVSSRGLHGNTFGQGKQTALGEKVLPTPTLPPAPGGPLSVATLS